MIDPQREYVRVGKEWPLWVTEGDVGRADRSGAPVSVYPESVDLTALGEPARGLGQNKGYVGVPIIGGLPDLDVNNNLDPYESVSYTHLTLPTKRIV